MKIYILFFSILISYCNFRSNEGNKRNQCVQSFLVTYSPSENLHYTPGGYTFRFSCSTQSNYTPTCMEYFSKDTIDQNFLCPFGYQRYLVRCSRQNLVGVCHESLEQSNRIVVSVFSKPNHSPEDAKIYCQTTENQKRNFFPIYQDPNEKNLPETQNWNSLILCISQKLK